MNTGLSRRGLFGASAAAAAILAGAPVAAASSTSQMSLRWWGNNGWEIRVGGKTILIDPWLTRFKTGTYTPAGADPHTPLSVNRALIDGYLDRGFLRADHILVTHGHYDHLTDVPYLAQRTGATVFGTETHLSLMAALGAPEDQLAIASGGEDLTFDGYSIRILRSLHSATGERARVPFPGSRPLSRRDRPRVIEDLVEGGTLAYAVSGGGASVVNFGGSNYIESELAGLRPDVACVPVGGAKVTQYVPRLLRALGNPRFVAATHWDDFDLPLGQAHDPNGGLEVLRKAVAATSSEFVVLDHLGSFTP
ncbi:MBL fold metallo-hydrolase [Amycolatopsis sp. OK19-0408]|uniref:MBL fold metallo-hydrolase n=1 Tax=Amycolatopsis iheyensis TaxID=2945988 RepID=A0A9X2SNF1_9PSEU|nr:MBL fold metallo-hydrolase [Amycolatopsis iheyensis]MCR6488917.1 MBL fold metallo-hydrolase [Amycolatopsis iheyensis]